MDWFAEWDGVARGGGDRGGAGRGAGGAVCVVADELSFLDRRGGIGSANWLLARCLAAAGMDVRVLYCGWVEDRAAFPAARDRLAAAGIELSHLDEFLPPGTGRSPTSRCTTRRCSSPGTTRST